jgi:hypothetical protein
MELSTTWPELEAVPKKEEKTLWLVCRHSTSTTLPCAAT